MAEQFLVCQGAECRCNFGSSPDKLVVKTQSSRYINDNSSQKLLATNKELGQTFEKNTFGSCSKKNGNACTVTVEEWSNVYEEITLEENGGSALIDISKATCPVGSKDCIRIIWHGQTAQVNSQNIENVDENIQNQLMPLVNQNELLNADDACPDCQMEHIDLREQITWQTQFNSKWGDSVAQNLACKKTCDAILISVGLSATSSSNLYQTAEEEGKPVKLKIKTEQAKLGVAYINSELEQNHPVQVGVDHTLGKTANEGTTDHFVVIVGRGCEQGKVYYLFYEVGTTHKGKGTSDNNKLYLETSDYSLKGKPVYSTTRNYTVSQVRKN